MKNKECQECENKTGSETSLSNIEKYFIVSYMFKLGKKFHTLIFIWTENKWKNCPGFLNCDITYKYTLDV